MPNDATSGSVDEIGHGPTALAGQEHCKTSQPLRGTRVLELGQVAAGPFASSLLADLGADVVKIEQPERGDALRAWPPFRNGRRRGYSENFASINRGKRSLVLDLKTAEGTETLGRLIDVADVFVENFRPGVVRRLGFGPEAARERNERLVYCSISGFGTTGPFAAKGAFDVTIQAASGLMDVTGERDGPPVKCGVPVADFVAALYAVVTILACLRRVQVTGKGAFVDCPMFGAVLGISALQTSEYFGTGRAPERLGADHPRNAPYGLFEARDRPFIVAAGTTTLWGRFCDVIGRTSLRDDPRFASQEARATNQEELRSLLRPIFASRDAEAWLADLEAAGIPCAVIATIAEALASPEADALGLVTDLALPNGSATKTVGFPARIDGNSWREAGRPPGLGEHTAEVLSEWLRDATQPSARASDPRGEHKCD